MIKCSFDGNTHSSLELYLNLRTMDFHKITERLTCFQSIPKSPDSTPWHCAIGTWRPRLKQMSEPELDVAQHVKLLMVAPAFYIIMPAQVPALRLLICLLASAARRQWITVQVFRSFYLRGRPHSDSGLCRYSDSESGDSYSFLSPQTHPFTYPLSFSVALPFK